MNGLTTSELKAVTIFARSVRRYQAAGYDFVEAYSQAASANPEVYCVVHRLFRDSRIKNLDDYIAVEAMA
jgi:hypothetical protein